ncbi:MAG: ABC transporter ATP-binding protein [Chloroflexi bacterium]|nr:ABC transporter ATP-binding protein [Chloroflexota bacterium]
MNRVIEIMNLHYTYPDGHVALRGVNLTVSEGERVAVTGPNGAGKSTLCLHLNGVLRGQGTVRILGMDVSDGHLGVIRARVGLVFQDPNDQLFSPTVFDDVAFGPLHMGLPEHEVRERVRWALAQVGMSGFEGRMPHRLSLGERKRVAIATVLSMQPTLLVLDEPSLGLDPRARRELIDLLAALPQTMLVASHDMLLVRDLCERTVILDQGKIVADGRTADILQDTTLLKEHGLELPL